MDEPLAYALVPYYKALSTVMPPEIQQLSIRYNLYLLSYGFDLEVKRGEKITRVILSLQYPTGESFLTYSMSPDTEIEETEIARANVVLGLDSSLKFRIPDAAALGRREDVQQRSLVQGERFEAKLHSL